MGQGYKNLIPVKDSMVHSRSARGFKNPQRLQYIPSAKAVNTIINDLYNFNTFTKTKDFEDFIKSNHRVIRYRNTFIKKVMFGGEAEATIQNMVADELDYYPKAVIKQYDGREYLITHEISGNPQYSPIQELRPYQKIELSKVTKFLYQKGYIDFDLRKDNIIIDRHKRPLIIDFDSFRKIDNPDILERQYNLNILSIFGFRDSRARHFTTMSMKELGLE